MPQPESVDEVELLEVEDNQDWGACTSQSAGTNETRTQLAENRLLTRPRVRLLYNDEDLRDRFCVNAQRLLNAVLEDPLEKTKSAKIAHKALRYRNIMSRLEESNLSDPEFDVCKFFGVEWCKKATVAAMASHSPELRTIE